MLTYKQSQLLYFIQYQLSKRGVSPSYEEMKNAIGLASKSGIHRLILALEERGYIKRLQHKARALEVIRLPMSDGLIPDNINEKQNHTITDPRSQSRKVVPLDKKPLSHSHPIDLPILGYIAAGVPIEAIQSEIDQISIPAHMLPTGKTCFALKVKGDSMVNAGILENDIVILEKTSIARSGDIIVALIDNTEATLKYFYQKGERVALEAANPLYGTRLYHAERITIQGKLIHLYRHYT